MWVLLTLALVICRRVARDSVAEPEAARALLRWAPLLLFLIGVVAVRRYDAVVSFLVCATLGACLAGRSALAGVALGLGIASKGVPLLVAPLLAIYLAGRGERRALLRGAVAAVTACGVVVLPALLVAGSGLWDTLRYHAARPLQIESTLGAFAALVGSDGVRVVHTFGSFNVVGGLAESLLIVASLLPWVALGALYMIVWRGSRKSAEADPERGRALILAGAAGGFVLWMALGKVFSAQFVTWLLPLGLLVSLLQPGASRWLLLGALAATQLIYPFCYHLVLQRAPWMLLIVIARNLSLVVWLVLLLRGVFREVGKGRGATSA
jgi:uncharacterized membrane protein